MARFTLVRTADAPAETVFDVLTDYEAYPDFTSLRRAELEREGTPEPNGVGAIRKLFAVGPPLREEIIGYDRPRELRYRLLSGAPVRDHVGTVRLLPYGDGTQVSYSLETYPSLPIPEFALLAVVRPIIGQMLKGVVAEAERRTQT
jgi:uncharacterized protein YndB with AHSA1/START domain